MLISKYISEQTDGLIKFMNKKTITRFKSTSQNQGKIVVDQLLLFWNLHHSN